jgi:hypothetical protein
MWWSRFCRDEADQHAMAKKTAVFLRNMVMQRGACVALRGGLGLRHIAAVFRVLCARCVPVV